MLFVACDIPTVDPYLFQVRPQFFEVGGKSREEGFTAGAYFIGKVSPQPLTRSMNSMSIEFVAPRKAYSRVDCRSCFASWLGPSLKKRQRRRWGSDVCSTACGDGRGEHGGSLFWFYCNNGCTARQLPGGSRATSPPHLSAPHCPSGVVFFWQRAAKLTAY